MMALTLFLLWAMGFITALWVSAWMAGRWPVWSLLLIWAFMMGSLWLFLATAVDVIQVR